VCRSFNSEVAGLYDLIGKMKSGAEIGVCACNFSPNSVVVVVNFTLKQFRLT
jgi:hypothetical protein